MRISDWSSDVCSSDLQLDAVLRAVPDAMLLSLGVVDGRNVWRSDLEALLDRIEPIAARRDLVLAPSCSLLHVPVALAPETRLDGEVTQRSEEQTSELQSLMRISYAVLCLKQKTK